MSVFAIPVIDSLFQVVSKVIDKAFPDPGKKAEAQLALLKLQQDGELTEMQVKLSAILAEANSSDPWTSRARPSFMYVFYTLLLTLAIFAPFVGVFFPAQMEQFYTNVSSGFKAIPEAMWWTFTTGYLGYAGARTYEKSKGASK